MNPTLLEIDAGFTNQYKGLLEIQRGITHDLEHYPFDLTKDEITLAVRERMMAFWHFHFNNCKELNREVNSGAADFFTETCLFFLKLSLKRHGLEVVSEKDIRKVKKGQKRILPDISIWKDSELVAVIELKVSEGWKGKMMIPHLDERKAKIVEIWPEVFFGVISFWNCFKEEFKTDNSEYIGLYKHDDKNNHPPTEKTIEQIIRPILVFAQKK
jgi:hypothetical protein